MGRGIALQFKKAFPENFIAYSEACKRGDVQPGKMFVFETGQLTNPRFIVNFPTKRHWRGKSRMEDIETGLDALVQVIRDKNIKSIAIPPLGSGLGGLDWEHVKSRVEKAVGNLKDVQIIIFNPRGAPKAEKMVHCRKEPNMTVGRAALIVLMERYLSGLLDPFISLLELHKLMYFLQEAGESLRLRYNKAPYGPYAENLRHVLNQIEGHLILGYADGGDEPTKQLSLISGAINDAHAFLDKHPKNRKRLERVADLVEGFESSYGLELLSSVHWVVKKERAKTKEHVIEMVHGWNPRKHKFTPRQINLSVDLLVRKRWLEM